eukprot:13416242-Alexandrium_andersonii.AAC.1
MSTGVWSPAASCPLRRSRCCCSSAGSCGSMAPLPPRAAPCPAAVACAPGSGPSPPPARLLSCWHCAGCVR